MIPDVPEKEEKVGQFQFAIDAFNRCNLLQDSSLRGDPILHFPLFVLDTMRQRAVFLREGVLGSEEAVPCQPPDVC